MQSEPMIAVRSGSLIYCRPCDTAMPTRNLGKRLLKCNAGHTQNSITVALALSTDDDEVPPRLNPPLHCWPGYAVEDMEAERTAVSKSLLEVP